MPKIRTVLIVFVIVFCGPAVGQAIYTCQSSDGSLIYSSQGCAENQKQVGFEPVLLRAQLEQERLARRDPLDKRESQCVYELTRDRVNASDSLLYELANEKQVLQPMFYDPANASSKTGILKQIRELESRILAETDSRSQAISRARDECRVRRENWENEADSASTSTSPTMGGE
ncbi:MAG: hypothetical protein ABIY56_09365 [Dokdonella sp.]